MSRFQFILVGVAALCMVGCVFVPPASATYIRYWSCVDPINPILRGRIQVIEINQSSPVLHFRNYCGPEACPPPGLDYVLDLPALTGQQFVVRILDPDFVGDCVYFDTRGGNSTLKPEAIPTANPATITVTAIGALEKTDQ